MGTGKSGGKQGMILAKALGPPVDTPMARISILALTGALFRGIILFCVAPGMAEGQGIRVDMFLTVGQRAFTLGFSEMDGENWTVE